MKAPPCPLAAGIIQDRGINDWPRLLLAHPSGARAEIYRHGAHVTSWKDARGAELLFLSRRSWFEAGRPIRGGIPIVFPQFSDEGPLPKHGLARTGEWTLAAHGMSPAGEVCATLRLEENADTLRVWPFRFALECAVRLSASLALRLTVRNTGVRPFRFQAALHTYFRVADIRRTAVLGLRGVEFIDSLRQGRRETEQRRRLGFKAETDRVYVRAPDRLQISDAGNRRRVTLVKSGLADAVVWNPWSAKARRMEDFGAAEYRRMVCVETGEIARPVTLRPGARWEGATEFSAAADRHKQHGAPQ